MAEVNAVCNQYVERFQQCTAGYTASARGIVHRPHSSADSFEGGLVFFAGSVMTLHILSSLPVKLIFIPRRSPSRQAFAHSWILSPQFFKPTLQLFLSR